MIQGIQGDPKIRSDFVYDKRLQRYGLSKFCRTAHLHKAVRTGANCNCEMTVGIARVDIWEAKLGSFKLRAAVQKLSADKAFLREKFDVSFRWS